MQYGEIGTINKDGKQVGGFRGWALEVRMEEVSSGLHRKYIAQSVKARANVYYLLEPTPKGKYMCIFYQLIGKELAPIFQNELLVKLPKDAKVGGYISAKLEMEG